MTIVYKVLGQINPSSNVATTLYTVPTYVSTVISTITVCNQASTDTTFSIAVRPGGESIVSKHYLNFNTTVSANDTIPITVGLTLATTDVITASAASGTVSFVAFGSEISTIITNIPAVTGLTVTDSSYNALTSTAVSLSGGYIKLAGSGFTSGATVYVNGVAATSTTFVSGIEVRAQVPAFAAGTYSVMVFNSSGLGAIYANGVVYSAAPSWTSSSYNNPNTGNVVNVQLLATGDVPLTYSLQAGSTLPTGVTLSSTGLVSGTATGISSSTTVTFTVVVTDPQSQSAPQLISLSLTFYIGKLYAWGQNSNGKLGLTDVINRSSPVQVGSLTDWKVLAAGPAASLGVKTNGTLWSWGLNSYGLLGLGDGAGTNRSSPVQVGALTNWLSVSNGDYFSVAIKTNGTLWAWGQNSYGQLGQGDTIHRSSPVQVGALTNWNLIGTGISHTIASNVDGAIWAFGRNLFGQLGLGDTINRSSPVQVGTLTTWSKVSAVFYNNLVTKTDGTLWSWGYNVNGQLGLGDTINRSSPVQVGLLTNWKSGVIAQVSAALNTNNALWTWGRNTDGQLGQGDTNSRSSPVQVGSLTDWLSVTGGLYSVTAIKTDGTLWVFGQSTYGQLGLGDNTSRSSPVQVGSATTWIAISSSSVHVLAISS